MTTTIFDTLAYAKKLRATGVSEAQAEVQAEALAEVINEKIATKDDLKNLEERLTYKLTIIFGTMLVASVSITVTIIGFLIKLH